MAIKIDMLRFFKTVVECGSLDAAAMTLNRTPSAISMILKQFESELGVSLFATSRKNQLTPVGQKIYKIAQQQVSDFDKALEHITALSREIEGQLKVVVTPSVAIAILPSIVQNFIKKYPNVKIEVRDTTSAQACEMLKQQQADIGIACLHNAGGLQYQHLFSDYFGVVCRKDHPKVPIWDALCWADMADENIIANDLCKFIQNDDFMRLRAKAHLTIPNTLSLLGMVRAGLGVTILPSLAATLLEPDLVFLPLKAPQTKREIFLLTQPIPSQSKVVTHFIEEIQAFDFANV